MAPVSGLVTGLPLRPVTMNASFGPATLMRETTMPTTSEDEQGEQDQSDGDGPHGSLSVWLVERRRHESAGPEPVGGLDDDAGR